VEESWVVPARQPAIPRPDAAAEGVRRVVQPSRLEVEADGRRRAFAEEALAIDGKLAAQEVAFRLTTGGGDGGDERHQVSAEVDEDGGDLGGGGAGLVLVEQRIVTGRPVADGVRLPAKQTDDGFQVRRKGREVAVL